MKEASSIFENGLETAITERYNRHQRLMKDLDAVMDVLSSFCNQADWMMSHDYRIGELVGEVVVASTEVEHILPRTLRYYEEYQRMLLPAINRHAPNNFDNIIRKVNGIILQLKPYCDKVKEDKEGLAHSRKGEIELTGQFNDKFIAFYESVIENFTASITLLERYINESHKKHLSIPNDIIKLQFDTMFKRYCAANNEELVEYAEDIEDFQTARTEIISANQSSDLFQYYHQYANHPELMIKALRHANKKEMCLLYIFHIKSKFETINQIKRAAKRKGNQEGDNEQPQNLVFKKYHDGKPVDFFTIRKVIEIKLARDIKHQYEWYAAYRILYDIKLLDDFKLTSFASQMNTWFPEAKVRCDAESLGDYATGHTGKNYHLWDDVIFMAEKKNNQTKSGFRKLSYICHDLMDALKTIPTLLPRME